MTKENKFKIGLCLQGIALSMDEITLKANEDRLKMIEEIIIAEPTGDKQESKTEYCKDCKYFEYDSMAKVDGIPLIVAHEICSKWGDGCKTKEDGYCFLFEPQERSDKE